MIYFVLPVDEISDLMMAEAVETDKDRLHVSNDGTLAILSVNHVPSYVFAMRRRYTWDDIQYMLENDANWIQEDDEE